MRRCPYLEEHWKDRAGPLRVYHYDCHVDGRSHRKITLRDNPMICLKNFEDCDRHIAEKGREDGLIRRYTE